MKKDVAIKKNLELLNEFMKYAFEHPDVMDKIPPEAELVILPVDDKRLCDYNKKTADKLFSQGKTVVLVRVKQPEPLVPELEMMMLAGFRSRWTTPAFQHSYLFGLITRSQCLQMESLFEHLLTIPKVNPHGNMRSHKLFNQGSPRLPPPPRSSCRWYWGW